MLSLTFVMISALHIIFLAFSGQQQWSNARCMHIAYIYYLDKHRIHTTNMMPTGYGTFIYTVSTEWSNGNPMRTRTPLCPILPKNNRPYCQNVMGTAFITRIRFSSTIRVILKQKTLVLISFCISTFLFQRLSDRGVIWGG